MMMKIHLYLYDYELIFTGKWELPYIPNVGESINIFPFLSEKNQKDLEGVLCDDIASDCSLSPFQKRNEDAYLLRVLYNQNCTIEHKTWKIFDGEWICTFILKM